MPDLLVSEQEEGRERGFARDFQRGGKETHAGVPFI